VSLCGSGCGEEEADGCGDDEETADCCPAARRWWMAVDDPAAIVHGSGASIPRTRPVDDIDVAHSTPSVVRRTGRRWDGGSLPLRGIPAETFTTFEHEETQRALT
jgi:hypothetical protein